MNGAQLGGGSIKSIQRGTVVITSGTSSASASITAVDTSKTELRMLGFSTATIGTTDGFPRINLAATTAVNASRGGASGVDITISWELTERY